MRSDTRYPATGEKNSLNKNRDERWATRDMTIVNDYYFIPRKIIPNMRKLLNNYK